MITEVPKRLRNSKERTSVKKSLKNSFLSIPVISVIVACWLLMPAACHGRRGSEKPWTGPAGQSDTTDPLRNPLWDRETTGRPEVFDKAVKLIKQHYVKDVTDSDLFHVPFNRLAMMLPPHCMEEISVKECSGDQQRCFMEAVEAVADKCGLDREKLFMTVLNLLLREMDKNSCIMDAAMIKELKVGTSGKFGGVGMAVAPRDGEYVVISPFEGSPAHRAGIQPGDSVMEIDGRPLHGLTTIEVLRLVRGPVGSTMTVTVLDRKTAQTKRLKIRRSEISVPPIRYAVLGDGISYVRIVNFQHNTLAELEKALVRLSQQGRGRQRGLILDLRDNPGGLFNEAIKVADLFLSSEPITSVRARDGQRSREFRAKQKEPGPDIPIVVLINKGTASASEILAGALQGRPQVVVMGRRSFGKASVQAVFPLAKTLALRLTTAHYYTADGRDIEGKGLEPDIVLDASGKSSDTPAPDKPDPNELKHDAGIAKAVDYLKSPTSVRRSVFPTLY
jgi:C-terminal peptidase prc